MHDTDENVDSSLPKQFETKISTVSKKLGAKVKVKTKIDKIKVDSEYIELKKGEYIKLIGITSINRTPLFNNNLRYIYLLELTNNLDFIATSFLGGVLDKMTLISEETQEIEKNQFLVKNDIIFMVYGSFPDKKGAWILEQMHKHFSDLIKGKDVDNLPNIEKHGIKKKFRSIMKFILEEYLTLQEVFSDQEIPYIEDKIRVFYLGLSSKSIGVISLVLGDELNIPGAEHITDPDDLAEMKESQLTARIEAIAANTLGNTGAIPRWIAVKLGFQNYRFLTFKKLDNEYYISLLFEGNLGILEKLETKIRPYFDHVTDNPFAGNLKPFNRLKATLYEKFSNNREFY